MMLHYRKSYEVIGYYYEADLHCLDCAFYRFGVVVHSLDTSGVIDREGNSITPAFLGDEYESYPHCGDCFEPLDYGEMHDL